MGGLCLKECEESTGVGNEIRVTWKKKGRMFSKRKGTCKREESKFNDKRN